MTDSHEVDVVIVGAGLSGSALAAHLAEMNMRVLMLQHGSSPPANGGEILKQGAIAELETLGALRGLTERGALKCSTIRYFHDKEPLIESDYRHTRRGYFLVAPYRDVVAAAAERATRNGAEIWVSTEIASVCSDSNLVRRLVLRDGRSVSASAYVCAEQRSSDLSEWIGAKTEERLPPHVLWATSATSQLGVDENRMYFCSSGWFAYFYPLSRGTRVFIGVPSRMLGPTRDLAELRSFVPGDHIRTAELIGEPFQRVNIASRLRTPYHRGNAVLLGGAAWTAHPMTGQGMSHALRDARVLASCIARSAADPGKLERLISEEYEPRRHVHRRVVAYGDALASSYPDRQRYMRVFDWEMHGDAFEDALRLPGG